MTTHEVRSTDAPHRPRALTVALWVLQVLLAAVFLSAAFTKLSGDPAQVEGFEAIGFGQWFRYLTGVCELAGAIGLLVPRLCGLAAIALVGLMACATLTNLFLIPGMALVAILTVALGILLGVVARARWADTRELLARLRR